MQALVVTPGVAGSTRVAEVADARPAGGEVLLRAGSRDSTGSGAS